MNILLDTQSLIWLLEGDTARNFGSTSKSLLEKTSSIFVSPISIIEIRIKSMLGKLQAPVDLIGAIERANCQQLPFVFEAADAITDFPELATHDPFDRMLLAQAKAEYMQLMTTDKKLLDMKLPYVLNGRV